MAAATAGNATRHSAIGDRSSVRSSVDLSDYLMSFVALGAILSLLLIATPDLHHWFVVPVYLSGGIIGSDAVKWFRGRYDVFDPFGIVGLLGVHFFFAAPLLHVYWDAWLLYLPPLDDWRHWLGLMAWINLFGIVIYFAVRNIGFANRSRSDRPQRMWRLADSRFTVLVFLALGVTGLMQLLVYAQYGGISGYINSYSERSDAFAGMGLIFALAESFPILALFAYAAHVRGSARTRTWIEIGLVLVIFLVLKLLFGGFRGSRSNTIWGVFWAVGVIHFWVRPIPRKVILAGLVPIVIFMYLYGFYKAYGGEVFQVYQQSGGSLTGLEEQSNRTFEGVLLWDLGRADMQAYTLHHLYASDRPYPYDFRNGETYLGSLALLVPDAVFPLMLDTKIAAGTDLLYGPNAYEYGVRRSTRIFGLAGEAMMNFGIFAIPVAFALWALIVAWVHRLGRSLASLDSRLLLYPLLVNLCFLLLGSDADNAVFFLVKNGLVPVLIVILGSSIVARDSDGSLPSYHSAD